MRTRMDYLQRLGLRKECGIFKVVRTVWILSCCAGLIVEASYSGQMGPAYRLTNRQCSSNAGCSSAAGEICWWLYDGCPRGHCMCDPRSHVIGNSDHCQKLVAGGETCTSRDICATGMHCVEGVCHCSGRMTADRMFCHHAHNKLLGEECVQGRGDCWQKASFGYTRRDVECSYKEECRCTEGYKRDGLRCRKWKIGESGCSESYHCEGGALCISSVCRCPTDYHPVAGGTKCAKNGAIYNLPLGTTCDELNEKRYCGYGLLCHKCSSSSPYKCVRHLLTDDRTYLNSSPHAPGLSAPLLSALILHVLLVLIKSLLPSQVCSVNGSHS